MLYRLPPSGFVQGTVTDANDQPPVAGATVQAIQGGTGRAPDARPTRRASTGCSCALGTYTIEATATNYETETAQVVLDQEDEVVTQDFALRTARGEVSPTALQFIVPPNQTRDAAR